MCTPMCVLLWYQPRVQLIKELFNRGGEKRNHNNTPEMGKAQAKASANTSWNNVINLWDSWKSDMHELQHQGRSRLSYFATKRFLHNEPQNVLCALISPDGFPGLPNTFIYWYSFVSSLINLERRREGKGACRQVGGARPGKGGEWQVGCLRCLWWHRWWRVSKN